MAADLVMVPAVHSSACIGVWPQAQREAASASTVFAAGDTTAFPNGASEQDSRISLSSLWISGSLSQLILPFCMQPCAYEKQQTKQRQDVAGTSVGCWVLYALPFWYSCVAREDRGLLWHMSKSCPSCSPASVIYTWRHTVPYFPNSSQAPFIKVVRFSRANGNCTKRQRGIKVGLEVIWPRPKSKL